MSDVIGTIRKLELQWTGLVSRIMNTRWVSQLTMRLRTYHIRKCGGSKIRYHDQYDSSERIGFVTHMIEKSGKSSGKSMSYSGCKKG